MSTELLLSQIPVFHKPSHDLESVFFIFVYLCTNLGGPNVPRSATELQILKTLPMASWFNAASSMERLGSDKMASMLLFEQRILPYFAGYFEDLKPCARQLYNTFYPNSDVLIQHRVNISHDEIIRIFNETLETLPPAPSGPPDQADQVNQVGLKRHLGIHDNSLNFNRLSKKKKRSSVSRSRASVYHSNSGIRSSTGGRSLRASVNHSNPGIRSSTGGRSLRARSKV
jgi:hypothetical protein